MWQHKQDNVMLPNMWPSNQVDAAVSNGSFPPQRVSGEHTENASYGPSYGNSDVDSLGGPTRKRKLTPIDQQSMAPESFVQFPTPRPLNLQSSGLAVAPQVGQTTPDSWVNQTRSYQPTNFGGQFQKGQFSYLNCEPGYWQANQGKSQGNGTLNTGNASACNSQPFDQTALFGSDNQQSGQPGVVANWPPQVSNNQQPGEPAVVSNWQPQVHNVLSQNEAHTSFAFANSYSGNPQVPPHSEEQMSYRTMNHQMLPEVQNVQSASIVSEGSLNQNFLEAKVDSHVNVNASSQENNNPTISYGFSERSHLPYGGTNDSTTLIPASVGSSLCAEQSQDPRLFQIELQVFNGNSFGVPVGKIPQNKELPQANDSLRMKMNPEQVEKSSHCFPTDVENGQSDRICDPKLDDKSKSFEKPAATSWEKLWDGCLQLSSSVTISAVAFFKSGEKLHDTDWYENVEVKGKVRLEAFEKYVQDLPRSRNRGLMVISICCKEESEGKGLPGMKEVAKGYQKSNRVGFAKLSAVVDLYVCPRSDTILTILAKHGYFKGMTVVEDIQDSMVGCVVWKKYPVSSSSIAKKLVTQNDSSTEKLSKSPSHLPVQQVAEKHSSMPLTSAVTENSRVQSESSYALSGSNSVEARVQATDGSTTASIQEAKKPEVRLENARSFMPVTQNNVTQNNAASFDDDDDDLPEFDFAAVRMVSQTTIKRPSNPVVFDKKPVAETVNSTDLLMLPGQPKGPGIQVPPGRSDYPIYPASEVMPPLKKVTQDEALIGGFPGAQESQRVQSNVTTAPPGIPVVGPSKGLFDDDDDDIPEWCPPELHGQPLREKSLTPMSMSPEPPSPKPTFRSSPPSPPTAHYSLSSAPQPKPPSAIAAASISILGPPPKLDEEHPFPPFGKWDSPRSDERRPYHPAGKDGESPNLDDRRPHQRAGSRFDDRGPYQHASKWDDESRSDDRGLYQPAGKRGEGRFDERRTSQSADRHAYQDPKFDDGRPANKWNEGSKFDDRNPYQAAGRRDEGGKFNERRPYPPPGRRDEGRKSDNLHPYEPKGKRDEGGKFDDRRPYQAAGRRAESPKYGDRRSFRGPSRWDQVPEFDDSRAFSSPGRRGRR